MEVRRKHPRTSQRHLATLRFLRRLAQRKTAQIWRNALHTRRLHLQSERFRGIFVIRLPLIYHFLGGMLNVWWYFSRSFQQIYHFLGGIFAWWWYILYLCKTKFSNSSEKWNIK